MDGVRLVTSRTRNRFMGAFESELRQLVIELLRFFPLFGTVARLARTSRLMRIFMAGNAILTIEVILPRNCIRCNHRRNRRALRDRGIERLMAVVTVYRYVRSGKCKFGL